MLVKYIRDETSFSVLQRLWTCWCEWRHMTEASTTHTTVMIQISKEDTWLPTLLQLKIVFDFVTDNCTVKLIVNYTTITFYWVNTPWRKYEGGYRACNKKRTKVYTYFIRCPTFGSKSGIGNPDKLPVAQVRLLCQECSQDTLTKYSGIFDIHELFTLALLEGNSKIGSWMILFG